MNRAYTGENLVFIVGAPRSGTTWLQRLLASHPRVRTGQESNLFCGYIGRLLQRWQREIGSEASAETATGRGGIGLPCYFTEEQYFALVKDHLFRLLDVITEGLQAGELFVEKSPDHARYVPEIKRLLPRSRIIHLIRDPRDVVASLLAASDGWGKAWAPKTPAAAAMMWVTSVRAACEAGRALGPDEYLEIRYEQLLSDPEATLAHAARFLGLAWDPAAVAEAVEANRPSALRQGGGTPIPVRGEFGRQGTGTAMDPPEFVRKARQGGWREQLGLRDKLAAWRVLRKAMREVGYSWSARDWVGREAGGPGGRR
ncbi:MAG TPA: sulfotransferase [Longimicrobiaceae bacterium]|nr:sulfotransferase [Longimicrobiaceae bacterium]